MKRKIILSLSFLIVFLAILWSCHNEDFTKGETNPQRNNANFFKHSQKGGMNARAGVDYINILEAYNRETDFLSKMPDKEGMPIWEKMYIIDSENATGLLIPLSKDNETLSSILFATLDEKNLIKGVKDYDNQLLKNIVYNSSIDRDFREKIFFTFMHMDNYTFGNQFFTGIPNDLFKGLKYNNEYGRLKIKSFEPHTSSTESGRMIYEENCGPVWSCKNHETFSQCDNCNNCYIWSCGWTMVWVDNDFPPSSNIPGEGGGGGGTPGSGGTPPKDPCALTGINQPFYRMLTGCNGTGDTDLPSLDDPCEKAQIPVSNANSILHEPNISSEMATMKSHAANANVEYGTAIMNIGSSTVAQDPYTDNEPVKVNIHIPSVGDYIANAHTHPCHGVSAPSLGDFYGDIKHVKDYPTFQGGYIFSCDGSIYAFIVEDRQKAIDFLNTFPEAENLNPNRQLINNNSQLGMDFNEIYKNYTQGSLPSYSGNSQADALESALALVLEKHNSGMILAKSDSNGNLKPLKSVQFQYTIPASGGKKITGYKAVPCP